MTVPRIEVWRKASKKRGELVEPLKDAPTLPAELLPMWELYHRLVIGRDRLSYDILSAYQSVSGVQLTYWEVDTLFKIDEIRLKNG